MAWDLLFGSEFGLMSLATILFVVVMAVFFGRWFSRKMDEDAKRQE